MRKTLLVAARDYNAAVRTKGFLVGLLVAPIMFGGIFIVVKFTEGRVDTKDRRIAIIDHTAGVAPALIEAAERRNESELYDRETGKKVQPAYLMHIVPANDADMAAQRLELSDKVREGELFAFLEIGPDVLTPGDDADASRIAYYCENPAFDDTRYWFVDPINDRIRGLRVAAAEVDIETVERVTRWMSVEGLGLLTVDEETGEMRGGKGDNEAAVLFMPYAVMMLMFVLIMGAVGTLVSAIMEEKGQRIAEVLLGSVRPTQLMAGKLLGASGVSITMVSIYLVAALLISRQMNIADIVPYDALPWFAVYGLAGLFMFGAIALALGSTCTDPKESQSLLMPMWLLIALPMFVWVPVVKDPVGSLATWLSLVPLYTPMIMLIRIASPVTTPAWQPWAGLVGVILFTYISVWAAGRVFRVGILMQGKPPKLGDILRWAVRG
jgi:ABC-2 type transport system permease protein